MSNNYSKRGVQRPQVPKAHQKKTKRRGRNSTPSDDGRDEQLATGSNNTKRRKRNPQESDESYQDEDEDSTEKRARAFMKELNQSIEQLATQPHWEHKIQTIGFENYFRYLDAKEYHKLSGQQKENDSLLDAYLREAQKLIESGDARVLSSGVLAKGLVSRLQEQWKGRFMLYITYDKCLILIIQSSDSGLYPQPRSSFKFRQSVWMAPCPARTNGD
jgi:hypothetical protein